ncbi:MAG: COG1361 S-layer family protein, partial [Candidatus Methanofastidiosia archaeon]
PSQVLSKTLRSDTFEIGKLDSKTSKLALFKIDIARDAKAGSYEIPVQIYYREEGGEMLDIKQKNFSLTINITGETLVDLLEVELSKENLEPGENFEIYLRISNVGDNVLEWLKVSLPLMPETPIVSLSSSEKVFRNVGRGESVNVEFKLSVNKNAEPSNYAIPLLLTYLDETKQLHTSQENLGIIVKGKAKLDMAGIRLNPEEIFAGDRVTLTITLDNTGTGDADAVSGVLRSQNQSFESYSGEIKKNDSGALFFSFKVPRDAPQKISYSLRVKYEDDFGSHEFERILELEVTQKEEVEGMVYVEALVGIVVVLILLFWYRRRKK